MLMHRRRRRGWRGRRWQWGWWITITSMSFLGMIIILLTSWRALSFMWMFGPFSSQFLISFLVQYPHHFSEVQESLSEDSFVFSWICLCRNFSFMFKHPWSFCWDSWGWNWRWRWWLSGLPWLRILSFSSQLSFPSFKFQPGKHQYFARQLEDLCTKTLSSDTNLIWIWNYLKFVCKVFNSELNMFKRFPRLAERKHMKFSAVHDPFKHSRVISFYGLTH